MREGDVPVGSSPMPGVWANRAWDRRASDTASGLEAAGVILWCVRALCNNIPGTACRT